MVELESERIVTGKRMDSTFQEYQPPAHIPPRDLATKRPEKPPTPGKGQARMSYRNQVCEALRIYGPISTSRAVEHLPGMTRKQISDCLTQMRKKGVISRDREGRYSLVKADKPAANAAAVVESVAGEMSNQTESTAAKRGMEGRDPAEIALLACPLCGGDELDIVNNSFMDEDNVKMVECRHCRCSGRFHYWNLRKPDRQNQTCLVKDISSPFGEVSQGPGGIDNTDHSDNLAAALDAAALPVAVHIIEHAGQKALILRRIASWPGLDASVAEALTAIAADLELL